MERRVKKAQQKHAPKPRPDHQGSLLAMAWRLSTEFLVSVLVGTGLGFGLDYLFGTKPWMTLVGVGFGFAAGIRSVLRTANKMNALNADVPLGEDIGFDDLDEDER